MIAYCKSAGGGFRVKERLTHHLKKTTKCPSISENFSGDVSFFCNPNVEQKAKCRGTFRRKYYSAALPRV
jgi:hypothetical protein